MPNWQLPVEERARREHEFQSIPPAGFSEQGSTSMKRTQGAVSTLFPLLRKPRWAGSTEIMFPFLAHSFVAIPIGIW